MKNYLPSFNIIIIDVDDTGHMNMTSVLICNSGTSDIFFNKAEQYLFLNCFNSGERDREWFNGVFSSG